MTVLLVYLLGLLQLELNRSMWIWQAVLLIPVILINHELSIIIIALHNNQYLFVKNKKTNLVFSF